MKRKGLMSLVLILLLSTILAACSSGSNTETNSSSNNTGQNNTGNTATKSPSNDTGTATEGESSDTIDEPVTLAITNLGGSSIEQNEANFGKAIREKFPNVTIEWKMVDKERRIEHLILDGENIDL